MALMIFLEPYLNVLLPFTQYGLAFYALHCTSNNRIKTRLCVQKPRVIKRILIIRRVCFIYHIVVSVIFLFRFHSRLNLIFQFGVIFKIKCREEEVLKRYNCIMVANWDASFLHTSKKGNLNHKVWLIWFVILFYHISNLIPITS